MSETSLIKTAHARSELARLSIFEGASFLLLLVLMPLKQRLGLQSFSKVLGGMHGYMTLLYLAQVVRALRMQGLSRKQLGIALVSVFLPFGFLWLGRSLAPKKPIASS